MDGDGEDGGVHVGGGGEWEMGTGRYGSRWSAGGGKLTGAGGCPGLVRDSGATGKGPKAAQQTISKKIKAPLTEPSSPPSLRESLGVIVYCIEPASLPTSWSVPASRRPGRTRRRRERERG